MPIFNFYLNHGVRKIFKPQNIASVKITEKKCYFCKIRFDRVWTFDQIIGASPKNMQTTYFALMAVELNHTLVAAVTINSTAKGSVGNAHRRIQSYLPAFPAQCLL